MPIVDPLDKKPMGIVDPLDQQPISEPRKQTVVDKILGIGGPRYRTFPERAVRELGGAIKGFMEPTAPVGSREFTEGAVGPSTEIAAAFSPVSAGKLGRIAVKGTRPEIPTQEELATITTGAGQGYKGGVMEVPLKDHVLADVQKNILDDLHSQHFRDYGAPFVFRAVKELENIEGKTPTVADIETVRQVLNRAPFDQRAAAAVAKDKINHYLSEIQPGDTTLGQNVGSVLNEIRGNYSALKKSEMITNAAAKGHRAAETSGMGANLDNTLRQQIKMIRNNPKLVRGLSDSVIKEMDRVIKGSKVTNLARMLSRLGPKHPLTGWGFGALNAIRHGSGEALLSLGVGHVAQKMSEGATQRGIQNIDELIRMQSPLFRQRQGGTAPIPSSVRLPDRLGLAATLPMLNVTPEQQ